MTQGCLQEQLNRIIVSERFARSQQLCRFLCFVVEQVQSGTICLKEQVIGTEVFKRGKSFNPGIDPIVRVQARRLRAKLTEYYQYEGCNDPIVIGLPIGCYAPVFRTRPDVRNPLQDLHYVSGDSSQEDIYRSLADCERTLKIYSERSMVSASGGGAFDTLKPADAIAGIRKILVRLVGVSRRLTELYATGTPANPSGDGGIVGSTISLDGEQRGHERSTEDAVGIHTTLCERTR
jgi:hypothetical protein